MRKIICTFIIFFITICGAYAQRTVNVCGEVDYVVPETQTSQEAIRIAINRAKLQAIANEFGTVISQTNMLTMHNEDGEFKSNFNSFSENDVRGIWIEDTKEPEIQINYENEMMVVHAKVCGKAKAITSTSVDLEIKTLNYGFSNGEENPSRKGYETTQFNDSDFFGVRFRSPVDGYVAMFIRDDNTERVYMQLPYVGSDGYARDVKSNQEYVFLTHEDPDFPYRASTILTTERKIENNTFIVVFSKYPFQNAISNQGDWFLEIEFSKFQKWLQSLRKHDETLQVQEILLTIKK